MTEAAPPRSSFSLGLRPGPFGAMVGFASRRSKLLHVGARRCASVNMPPKDLASIIGSPSSEGATSLLAGRSPEGAIPTSRDLATREATNLHLVDVYRGVASIPIR